MVYGYYIVGGLTVWLVLLTKTKRTASNHSPNSLTFILKYSFVFLLLVNGLGIAGFLASNYLIQHYPDGSWPSIVGTFTPLIYPCLLSLLINCLIPDVFFQIKRSFIQKICTLSGGILLVGWMYMILIGNWEHFTP